MEISQVLGQLISTIMQLLPAIMQLLVVALVIRILVLSLTPPRRKKAPKSKAVTE